MAAQWVLSREFLTMLQLLAILEDGSVSGYDDVPTSELSAVLRRTVDLYSRVGFEVPWISYLAVDGPLPVGVCSFKSGPVNGRVEIAYFTFPEYEGRGTATEMASQLVAKTNPWPDVRCVAAQTLLTRNASHRVLEKLGFQTAGTVEHPEDGVVLEWRLTRHASGSHTVAAADVDEAPRNEGPYTPAESGR
jgi:[ribosomal protein S5]-alanine N-acetyltransferase